MEIRDNIKLYLLMTTFYDSLQRIFITYRKKSLSTNLKRKGRVVNLIKNNIL